MKAKHLLLLLPLFFVFCSPKESANTQQDSATTLFGKKIPKHPRLLFSVDEENSVKELSKTDPLLNNLLQLLKSKADELLNTPTNEPPNNLSKSREHVYRIITLSAAYRMFDDDVYAQRAEELLVNVSKYPSWNPSHFLDVAETTTAVAIGYDWLYNYLNDDTKKLIEDAIVEKALNLSIPEYEASNNPNSWAKRETNWNVVCNTGMTLGALAVAENNPMFAEKIIEYSAQFVPNCLKHYDPDGVCFEGPGYWEYTNIYLALLLKSLNDNIGHDFGVSEIPGVSKAASYYVQSLSPTGQVFNFANSGGTASSSSPVFLYFGNTFNQPEVISYYKNKLTDITEKNLSTPKWHFFLSVAWYQKTTNPKEADFPPLQVFKNEYNPILVFNGDRSIDKSIYLTAKGGAPSEAHQQLDVGSFIIESEGVRWAHDLGTDNYSLPGFWDYKPNGQRWSYFRNTNFSHNTLSIDNKLQYSTGRGVLSEYETETERPFGVIDMSEMYKDQAKSVKRGFKLLDNRVMLIQDEITPLSDNQSICWTLITKAEIETDGNSAILKSEGKQFIIKAITPSNVKINIEEAKTYSTAENTLSGYTLLKIIVSSNDLKNNPLRILAGNDKDLIQQLSMNDYETISVWK